MKTTIRLEYFTKADFEQLIQWVNSKSLLVNWTGHMFSFPLTEDSLDWYIEGTNDLASSDALIYKAVDISSGTVVGHISLGGISRKNKAARISRVLVGNTCAKGKGICQQMVTEVLKVGFDQLQLHRISLGVFDFNKAAVRCYEKCGFTVEGIFRDVLRMENDEYWSLVEMSILEDEWRTMQLSHAA